MASQDHGTLRRLEASQQGDAAIRLQQAGARHPQPLDYLLLVMPEAPNHIAQQ